MLTGRVALPRPRAGKAPVMLCLAPTRELACQIQAVLEEAGSLCGVASVCVYGGVPKRDQVQVR